MNRPVRPRPSHLLPLGLLALAVPAAFAQDAPDVKTTPAVETAAEPAAAPAEPWTADRLTAYLRGVGGMYGDDADRLVVGETADGAVRLSAGDGAAAAVSEADFAAALAAAGRDAAGVGEELTPADSPPFAAAGAADPLPDSPAKSDPGRVRTPRATVGFTGALLAGNGPPAWGNWRGMRLGPTAGGKTRAELLDAAGGLAGWHWLHTSSLRRALKSADLPTATAEGRVIPVPADANEDPDADLPTKPSESEDGRIRTADETRRFVTAFFAGGLFQGWSAMRLGPTAEGKTRVTLLGPAGEMRGWQWLDEKEFAAVMAEQDRPEKLAPGARVPRQPE